MTRHAVQAVWVWRFTKAPYKATYGRLPGTTYSKDFLQAIGECARTLDIIFGRSPGAALNVRWSWPAGSRHGSLFEAADYDEIGRLDLRWETNNSPDPWRLFPDAAANPLKTFPGDPTHGTAEAADREFATFQARNLDPWLVVVKLFGEDHVLHARAYLGNPPPNLTHTNSAQLPERIRMAMGSVPAKGGCAVALTPSPASGLNRSERVLFDPSRIHDAWVVTTMDDASFASLVEEHPTPTSVPAASRRRAFSARYRPANVHVSTSAARVFTRDPDKVDRGLQGHNATQEKLAEFVRKEKLVPGSSVDANCDYDVAWERAGIVYVAEVKSLTGQNESLQLRLGLGQVLEYAYRLRSEGWTVQPVLAVERQPNNAIWVQVCESQGVRLVWPKNMSTLF